MRISESRNLQPGLPGRLLHDTVRTQRRRLIDAHRGTGSLSTWRHSELLKPGLLAIRPHAIRTFLATKHRRFYACRMSARGAAADCRLSGAEHGEAAVPLRLETVFSVPASSSVCRRRRTLGPGQVFFGRGRGGSSNRGDWNRTSRTYRHFV